MAAPASAHPQARAAGAAQALFGNGRWMMALLAVYVGAICLVPLARLFWLGLAPEGTPDLSLAIDLLGQPRVRTALFNTIEASLLATLLSVLLGAGMAFLVALTDIRGRAVLVFMLILPMLIPAQITALAWLEFLGPSSPVLGPLGLAPSMGTRNPLYSREGIVLLMGVEHSTIVFLAVRAALRSVPEDLVEAARAGGVGPLGATARIVLPLTWPAIGAGAALAFVSAVGNFGIPAFLGIPGRYPMMTTLIFQRLSGFGPGVLNEVAALALILAAVAGLGLLVQTLAMRLHSVELAGGRPLGAFGLGRARVPVEVAVWAVVLIVSVLPLVALVGGSLSRAVGVPLSLETATLDHYARVLASPATTRAFVNSSALAAAAAVICAAVSVVMAYFVARRRTPLARAFNLLTDAPYALPGTVLAIAVILVYLRPLPVTGIALYGTLWIILLAYLARFLALALRPTVTAMAGIEAALEEAAQIAGARPMRRLWAVLLPTVAPAAMAGGLLVFMGAFNELTVSILLWSTGNETLGVLVFNLYDQGASTRAASVSVLTVLATLGIAGVLTWLARRLPPGVLPWQA